MLEVCISFHCRPHAGGVLQSNKCTCDEIALRMCIVFLLFRRCVVQYPVHHPSL